jgi:hypothetical protein
MKYELHMLTKSESTVVHPVDGDEVLIIDQLIPFFGNRMSEVTNISVVAKTLAGDVVIFQQAFEA